jgi:hypothetical protein
MNELELFAGPNKVAWADQARWVDYKDHRIVAAPLLWVEQDLALELVAGKSYAAAFSRSTAQGRPVAVLHASFDLYRTGRAAVVDFAALVVSAGPPLPDLYETLARASQLLRGQS